jgi:signal transduction histidine kinase/CheY-like chemotaxis protein
MKDDKKTKKQLIDELNLLRDRIKKFEAFGKKVDRSGVNEIKTPVDALEDLTLARAFIDAIGVPVSIQDKDFRVLYQNTAHKELQGEDLSGEYCYRSYVNRDSVCKDCPIAMTFRDGKVHTVEKEGSKDKGIEKVEITSSPLRDRDGNIIASIEVVRDVTNRRKKETEEHIIQRMESIGSLAGGLAHSFNNILTVIEGSIALAKMYAKPGLEIFDILVAAEKASQMAKNLVQQLLVFSKGGVPVKEIISVDGLIRDSVSFVLSDSNIECEIHIDKDLVPIVADRNQLYQVINNLLNNAKQSILGEGLVRVYAKNFSLAKDNPPMKAGDYLQLRIEDNGIGIPPDNLDKIFDPYFSTKNPEVGLGLATAFSIIKRHEGLIEVKSELEVGTVFTIYLPSLKEGIRAMRDEIMAPVINRKTGAGKILVMDDEELVREVVKRMVIQCGYEVDLAAKGEEAISLYTKAKDEGCPYDAVILDLVVHDGMGGLDTVEELLKIDPGIKAIVSSGYSSDPIMAESQMHGFSGVLSKPYRLDELTKILKRITKK